MQAFIRRKIDMATQALEFVQAHPDPDPGAAPLVQRLEDAVARTNALLMDQEDGVVTQHSSVTQRQGLRKAVQSGALRHLVRIGKDLERTTPTLAGLFNLPATGAPHLAFLTSVKSLLDVANTNKAALLAAGLNATTIDELTQAVSAFQVTLSDGHDARATHVGATGALVAATGEGVRVTRLLDGHVRKQFAADPEQLAAWNTISRVAARPRRRKQPGPVPTPAPVPAPDPAVTPIAPVAVTPPAVTSPAAAPPVIAEAAAVKGSEAA